MCLRPVTIPNKRYAYRLGIDKVYQQVPCNDCEECRLQRINEYYVRLHYEWERYMKNKGSVFFVTMSYNNISLPYTPVSTSTEFALIKSLFDNRGEFFVDDYSGLQCFNKGHVRSFLERLHHLDRFPKSILRGISYYKNCNGSFVRQDSCFCDNDGVLRNPVLGTDIKHFVVCEYGHTTKRPHYHAIIFFPFIVSAGDFKRLCEFSWSTLVPKDIVPSVISDKAEYLFTQGKDYVEFRDYFVYRTGTKRLKTYYMRKNGFVMYSVKGAQMTRPVGMKYLCKYLFKDPEFLKIPFVADYISAVKSLPPLADYKESEFKRALRAYKDTLPFFLISNEVGTLFESEIKLESAEDAKAFAKKQFLFENDSNIYAMPKYFIRRLLYQNRQFVKIEDDNKRVTLAFLTDFGKNVMFEKFKDSVERFIDKVNMVSSSAFKSLLYPLDFCYGNTNCDVPFDLSKFYDELYADWLSIPRLRALAYYKLVYRNVECSSDYVDFLNSFDDVVTIGNKIFEQKVLTVNEHNHEIYDNKFIHVNYVEPVFNSKMYNNIPIFVGFDSFLSKLEYIYNLVHDRNYKASARKIEEVQKYRSLYNSLIYSKAI